jgi:arsenate reductase-like glutaredoxin family protein
LEENEINVCEAIPASRKLQAADARKLLKVASKLIVTKGKKLKEFSVAKSVPKEAIVAMLGPTGNLRAPTIRVGKTLLVGFNQDAFSNFFGSTTQREIHRN